MHQSPSSPPVLFLVDLSLFNACAHPGSSAPTALASSANRLAANICSAIDRLLIYSPNGTEFAFHTFYGQPIGAAPKVYPLQPLSKDGLVQLRKTITKRATDAAHAQSSPVQLSNLTAAAEELIAITGEPSYDSFLDADKTADRKISLFVFSNAPKSQAEFAAFAPSMDEASVPNVCKTKPLISNPNRANILWVNCSSSSGTPPSFNSWLTSQRARFVSLQSFILDRRVLPARIAVGSITRPLDVPSSEIKLDFLIPDPQMCGHGQFSLLFRGTLGNIVPDFKPLTNALVVARHFISKSDENFDDQDLHNAGAFSELPRFISPGLQSNPDPKINKVWAGSFAGLMISLQNTRCRLAVDVYEVDKGNPVRASYGIISPVTPVSASLRLVNAAAVGQTNQLTFPSDAFDFWKVNDSGSAMSTTFSTTAPAPVRGKRITSSFPHWMSSPPGSELKMHKESLVLSEILDFAGSKVSKATSEMLSNYARGAVEEFDEAPSSTAEREALRTDILKSLHEQLDVEEEHMVENEEPLEICEVVDDAMPKSNVGPSTPPVPEETEECKEVQKQTPIFSIEQAVSATIAAMQDTDRRVVPHVKASTPSVAEVIPETPIPRGQAASNGDVVAVVNINPTQDAKVEDGQEGVLPVPVEDEHPQPDVAPSPPSIPKQGDTPVEIPECEVVQKSPKPENSGSSLEVSESDAAIIEQLANDTVIQSEMLTQIQPFRSLTIAPCDNDSPTPKTQPSQCAQRDPGPSTPDPTNVTEANQTADSHVGVEDVDQQDQQDPVGTLSALGQAEDEENIANVPVTHTHSTTAPNPMPSPLALLLEAANVTSNNSAEKEAEHDDMPSFESPCVPGPISSIEAVNNEPEESHQKEVESAKPTTSIADAMESDGEGDENDDAAEQCIINGKIGLLSETAKKVRESIESLRQFCEQRAADSQRRLGSVKALVRKCMIDLSQLSQVAMSEGKDRHDVRKLIRRRARKSDSVFDELQNARQDKKNAPVGGGMLERHISPAFWYATMRSFEQIIWLSAATTFCLRKRSQRKRCKKFAKRVRTAVSVTQIAGKLDESKPESKELFEECFSGLFSTLLNPFMSGIDADHPADWLNELKEQFETEASWFQSPEKTRKGTLNTGLRKAENNVASNNSPDSGSKSRKRRLELLDDVERYESRESMRKSARTSRGDIERKNSGNERNERASLGDLVSRLKEKKAATAIAGRDRFSTVENRMRTGGKSQTKLAIKLDIKKLGKRPSRSSSKKKDKDKERNKRVDALLKNLRRNTNSDREGGDDGALYTAKNTLKTNESGDDDRRNTVLVEETPTKPTNRDLQRFALDETVEEDDEDDLFVCLSPGDDEEEQEMYNDNSANIESIPTGTHYNEGGAHDAVVVPETPL